MYDRYICPFCGCYLDPGEYCDCQDQKKKQERIYEDMLFTESDGQMRLREAVIS